MSEVNLHRRNFMKSVGIGTFAALGTGLLPAEARAAIDATEPLKITKIESIRIKGGPWWVRITTDKGITGLGETYSGNVVEALRGFSLQLIGKDPRDIDGIWRDYYHRMSMHNAGGSEMRMLSAVNMAQLDILGKSAGLPAYRLLGGKTRPKARVYNTTVEVRIYETDTETQKCGTPEDMMKVVRYLLDRKITAIKIYPFTDPTKGPYDYISTFQLNRGMDWIRAIRDEVGDQMDICVDLWGRFNLRNAVIIARALEPYNIMYFEDPMLNANAKTYERLKQETSIPICMSETLATRYEYREYLELNACDVVMYDLCWVGGITEAKKISDMADTYFIPTSPHTLGGPLLWFASCHIVTALPNFLIMESNYHRYDERFPRYINNVPVPVDGFVSPPELPGLGADVKPEIFKTATIETIAEAK